MLAVCCRRKTKTKELSTELLGARAPDGSALLGAGAKQGEDWWKALAGMLVAAQMLEYR